MSVALQNKIASDNTELKQYMARLGRQARQAADVLAIADPETKNAALINIAEVIDARREEIVS